MKAFLAKSGFTSLSMILVLMLASSALQARSLPDFVGMVEENSPAVVNISTTQHKTVRSPIPRDFQIPNLPENSPFNEFFRHFFDEGEGQGTPREYDARSLGSGFIISDDAIS